MNESCKDRFQGIDANIKEMTKRINAGAERLVKTEESTKSAHHRLDTIEERTEAVIRLAVSVEHIANQNQEILNELKNQREEIIELKKKPVESVDEETIEKINGRLDELEKKDGRNAEKLLNQIRWLLIALTVSAAFAFLWSQAIQKG